MAVNLSQIKGLLLPGLRGVTGEYKQYPAIYPSLFDEGKSNMAQEQTASMRYLGLAKLKGEGGQTQFDNAAGQRYVYNQVHNEIALGYAITRKAIDDNLYKSQFRPSNLGLNRSFLQTKEIFAAAVYNTATTLITGIGGDGQALCSTAHPVDGNTFANTFTVQADLNEASLLNAMISIRVNFVDNANLRLMATGKKLIIPPQLEPIAQRLLKTELRPGTSNNDINAIPGTAGGITDYVTNVFFTSQFAWFVKTDQPGLLYLSRVPYETDMQVDFTTDNLLVKGYERYSFSYFDPRAIFGSFPTS